MAFDGDERSYKPLGRCDVVLVAAVVVAAGECVPPARWRKRIEPQHWHRRLGCWDRIAGSARAVQEREQRPFDRRVLV